MKKEFSSKLNKILCRKKSNSVYLMSSDRYRDFIREVNEIKNKTYKNFEEYKMLANYDVLVINNRERLIQPKNEGSSCVKFYVETSELFGVLHTIHLLFNHANKDVMDSELKTKYCNVSKEVIKMYLSCCKICREKEVKFMTSQCGDKLIKLGDFTFTMDYFKGDHCYWSCYTHFNNGCPAKAYTEYNKLVFAKNLHNHPPTEFFV